MNHMIRVTFVCLLASLAVNVSAAEEQAGMARRAKPLLQDNFARSEMAPKWRVGKGWFTLKDGVVTAIENPDDHHGAYAKANLIFRDIVADFSFQLAGSPSFSFTMDDSTYKGSHAGHICQLNFSPTMVRLSDSKFGNMKNEVHDKMQDPKTTPEEKKKIQESIKDKSAGFKTTIEPKVWHQAHVEIVGDEMLVSVDGKIAGYLKSNGIGHPIKNLLGFTVNGRSTLIKDVKVWDATASPEWSSRRGEILAEFQKDN